MRATWYIVGLMETTFVPFGTKGTERTTLVALATQMKTVQENKVWQFFFYKKLQRWTWTVEGCWGSFSFPSLMFGLPFFEVRNTTRRDEKSEWMGISFSISWHKLPITYFFYMLIEHFKKSFFLFPLRIVKKLLLQPAQLFCGALVIRTISGNFCAVYSSYIWLRINGFEPWIW